MIVYRIKNYDKIIRLGVSNPETLPKTRFLATQTRRILER